MLGNIKCADSGMEEPSDIAGRMSAEADEPKDDDETRRNWKIDTYYIAGCVAEGKKLPHCSVPWLFCCPLFVLRMRNSPAAMDPHCSNTFFGVDYHGY